MLSGPSLMHPPAQALPVLLGPGGTRLSSSMSHPLHSCSGLQLIVDSLYLWLPITGSLWKPSDLPPRSRNFIDLSSDFVLALRHTSNRRVVDSYLPDSAFRPLDPQARPDSSGACSWHLYKTILPTRRRRNYDILADIHIDDDRPTAITKANNITGLAVYTNGSGYKGQIGAATVLTVNRLELRRVRYRLGPETQHTVYEAEIFAVVLALHLLTQVTCPIPRVTIGLDN